MYYIVYTIQCIVHTRSAIHDRKINLVDGETRGRGLMITL